MSTVYQYGNFLYLFKDLFDMESETARALRSLTGELAGTYTSLCDMDDETKKSLIANHYLYRFDDE